MKYRQTSSLFILLLCFFSCKEKQPPSPTTALPEKSVYQLASNWTTQDGARINIEALKGKVTILAMVYTNCRAACPRLIADLQRIESGLGEKRGGVQFVLVSMDPANDPPEKLLQLAKDYHLDPKRWTLLTGDNNDVLEIANVLDVRIRRDAEGDITDHSNLIFVLDQEGSIAHRQEGLSMPPDESIAAAWKCL